MPGDIAPHSNLTPLMRRQIATLRLKAYEAAMGHNGGPPLEEPPFAWGTAPVDVYFAWKRAHDEVWKAVPYHTMLRRQRNADALGLTYEEYTLELLFNGKHLQKEDEQRIAAIKAMRANAGS
jgi:hypothetical protein